MLGQGGTAHLRAHLKESRKKNKESIVYEGGREGGWGVHVLRENPIGFGKEKRNHRSAVNSRDPPLTMATSACMSAHTHAHTHAHAHTYTHTHPHAHTGFRTYK